jgi:uncharacterized membrane-anchored protein
MESISGRQEMVENDAPHFGIVDAANLGSGVTVGGGMGLWLTQNATAIGAAMLMVTGVTTVIFYILTYFANRRGQNIRRTEIERQIYNDLLDKASPEQKEVLMTIMRGG